MEKKIKSKEKIRLIIQALFFALTNGYVKGFIEGKIYRGKTKLVCVPGLNCYSCPGALGACPIGSLQSVLGDKGYSVTLYVAGFIMGFGALMGRVVCGFLCPFGLVQDLLYKIPLFKKKKNMPGHKWFSYLRFVVLILLVILLPLLVVSEAGYGSPWFCEYLCPSGTLFGGVPLVLMDENLQEIIGVRFWVKISILLLILLLSVKYYRPFCKYLCPLGAMYGLLNPIAFYRYDVDKEKCNGCGKCREVCKMDIDVCNKANSMECIRCGQCKAACPKEAIKGSFHKDGLIIVAVAVILIVAGIYLKEHTVVLKKAINICLECIGIG